MNKNNGFYCVTILIPHHHHHHYHHPDLHQHDDHHDNHNQGWQADEKPRSSFTKWRWMWLASWWAGGDEWVGMIMIMTMITFDDYHDDHEDDNDNLWNGNNDTLVGVAAY